MGNKISINGKIKGIEEFLHLILERLDRIEDEIIKLKNDQNKNTRKAQRS